MTKHMLSSALFAGFAVGLLVALLQYALVEQKILLAERYESHELVYYQGVVPDHAEVTATVAATEPAVNMPNASTDHDHATMEEASSPLVRQGLSVLFAGVIYVGYALVMVSGFGIALRAGKTISVQTGLLWGLAGFMAFQMAPALGLEPELPGTLAADLTARQLWWAGCVLATVAGIALLAYGKGLVPRVIALALLAAPHVFGAPQLESFSGITPPELASSFASRSLGVGLIAWVCLGGLLAWFWNRDLE